MANAYEYGPYGVELMKNIKDLWWKRLVQDRDDMVGIDTQIIQHPTTWIASGHVGSFSDPLVEDVKTNKRYRADHLIEAWIKNQKPSEALSTVAVEDMKISEMAEFIKTHAITSPDGNEITEPKAFNLLFETEVGTVSGEKSKVYLRGETAQGIFTNFKQIVDSCRVRLPFGVGQMGKSFRNEITTGQFVFRTFEFEHAEIEYFFDPEAIQWTDVMEQWKTAMWDFVTRDMKIQSDNIRWRQHTDTERSHYSTDTYDLDYHFPFGWKELWGVAYRADYDLKQHMQHSGKSLEWVDSATGRKFIPHVVEPAVGVNRLFLMALSDAYTEEDLGEGKKRTVLRLAPALAPVKAAIFPLQKNEELRKFAESIYRDLKKNFRVAFDDAGNIGKMYRRQDEIGTPCCITVDFDSIRDESVTVRDRDTMKQERVSISNLAAYISEKIS